MLFIFFYLINEIEFLLFQLQCQPPYFFIAEYFFVAHAKRWLKDRQIRIIFLVFTKVSLAQGHLIRIFLWKESYLLIVSKMFSEIICIIFDLNSLYLQNSIEG